jgi:hypothetical protein
MDFYIQWSDCRPNRTIAHVWYGYKFGKAQVLGGIFDIGDSCDGIVMDNDITTLCEWME